MPDDPEEHLAVLIEPSSALDVARPSLKLTPAQLYVAGLHTDQSRSTAVESLKRLIALLTRPGDTPFEWWAFPYEKLTFVETTLVQTMLVERYAPSTARLTKSIMMGVLKKAYQLDLMGADQYVKATTLLPQILGSSGPAGRMLKPEEIEQLTSHFDQRDTPYARMVVAVLAASIGGGLRRDELTRLPLSGYDRDEKTLRFVGKRKKTRTQALPDWAVSRFEEWLEVRGERTATTMFLYARGSELQDRPPTVKSIWAIINRAHRKAGTKPFAPHDLRRTFASNMIEDGDIGIAQRAMGHENATTTVRYDRRDDSKVRVVTKGLKGNGFERKRQPKESEDMLREYVPARDGRATGVEPGSKHEGGLRVALGDAARRRLTKLTPVKATPPGVDSPPEGALTGAEATVVSQEPKPVTINEAGQPLVRVDRVRRVNPPIKFRRDGNPLDLIWARRQAKALHAKGRSLKSICAAFAKCGVGRGDGTDLSEGDVKGWLT